MLGILVFITLVLFVGTIGEKEKDASTRNLIAFIVSLILTVSVYMAG